ncbi:MAG: hypothetical protein CUN55_07410 [Phototrophicales bacterium]|nr:MAG: hypothetical protein CUN55_07410 [Phototrophicales bacterium]
MPTLLLFDVDGVLIQPSGYKLALRDTVNYFARRMGQADIDLSFEEIATFEACGLTNEWDSAALCVGALVVEVLLKAPALHRPTFDATLNAILTANVTVARPDFSGLAQEIAALNTEHHAVTDYTRKILCERLPVEQRSILDALFADIFSIETPTTRIQQCHTLGHQRFFETYGITAPFEAESYLIVHDTPLLHQESYKKLLAWRSNGERDFCIFTARPSLPPTGKTLGYAPEADLAAELLGLLGQVPIIGAGRLQWLAERHQRTTADYIKPYPTQALTAIGAALSQQEVSALEAAAALTESNLLVSPLADLRNQQTEVVVFEDSVGGILAAQRAVHKLQAYGLDVRLRSIGVSPEASKRAALANVADVVVDDVNAGVMLVLGDS